MHRVKNLFCYVPRICNLVQEFNGLVSKGSAAMLTLLLFGVFLPFSTVFFTVRIISIISYLHIYMSKVKTAFFCSNCGYESGKMDR